MRRICLFICISLLPAAAFAQYAPQAGIAGSTAIPAASGSFTGWATDCTVQRGYMNIADPSLGTTTVGDNTSAIGYPDGCVISLGDSGVATLTFAHPIYNGAGPDLAVFENGFANPADPSMAFLELAFVEVSSDGVHFTRFQATSNTQISTQIAGAGTYMDASLLNNLAGKYIAQYGTPFDLEELADSPGLDVNNIIAVRVIDVIGSVSGHSSYDHNGHIINDPYPTSFNTGGFDLDAVGALHQYDVAVPSVASVTPFHIYPNPASDRLTISVDAARVNSASVSIVSVTGTVVLSQAIDEALSTISISAFPAGMYYLTLTDASGSKWVSKFIKR